VISQQTGEKQPRFTVVDIDDRVVDHVLAAPKESLHGRFPHHGTPPAPTIGIGDSVVVTIWEAAANDQVMPGSRSVTLPEQMVGRDGAISVPFAGRIPIAGRVPVEV
jgi:polysaccharide export outer membrane protein